MCIRDSREAERAGQRGQRGVQRRPAEPVLQVEHEDQGGRQRRAELEHRGERAQAEAAVAEQRRDQHRRTARPGVADLPGGERDDDAGRGEHPGVRRRPLSAGQHERQQQAERDQPEQCQAGQVQGGATGARPTAAGQQPERERHGDQAERDVEQQDEPPAEVVAGRVEHQAADRGADDPGDATDGRVRPEGPGAGASRVEVLDDAVHLGIDRARAGALRQSGDRDRPRLRGGSGDDGGAGEQCDAAREEQAAAVCVAEPPRRDEGEPERQRVTRDDPLQRGRAGTERAAQRGDRGVEAGLVEQGGEGGAEADEQGHTLSLFH